MRPRKLWRTKLLMRLGITMGDPAGVGPELIVRALAAEGEDEVVVFGDQGVLERAARFCRLAPPLSLRAVTRLSSAEIAPASRRGGEAQLAYLEAGVEAARRGEIAGLVTAPIHKASCHAAGLAFPGHTEFLGDRLGGEQPVMMLAGPHLRVALLTTHLALADVPRALSIEGIARIAAITLRALVRDFGLARPRLALAALNPHAGENGHFGDEEERLLIPAMRLVENRLGGRLSFELSGPHVPDVVYRQAVAAPLGEGLFDAVLSPYHDQGLIPLKLLDFDEAVNVTLGLPIVRTSPDHGVAYDLAGTGRARDGSFRAALRLARALVARRAPT